MHDAAVVQEVLSGHPDAYATLVARHQGPLRRYCYSVLGNQTDADDAAQEVFIKAYKSLKRFRGQSKFSTWLYRIAVNHCKDLLRQKGRRPAFSWEQLVEKEGEKAEVLALDPTNPREEMERAELRDRILGQLSEDYRQVLTLREVEGLSYAEIAEILDSSLDSVKAKLRRARSELRDKLGHFRTPGNV
ncbi:MAG: sigma-70 family RNA polymerase sigma factor [Candidatus Omnitrophica bacterium]|nr:sigma-70 family RNA polymerase sigma factor [Candidatus Omnitrophota bacterium]